MNFRLAAVVLLACGALSGAPSLTTVQDVLFKADGTRFNGIVQIAWTTFTSGNTSFIAAQTKTVRVVDGNLMIKLTPTVDATPAAYYTVRYWSDGKIQFLEKWTVPETPTKLRVRDVRTEGPVWPGLPGTGGSTGGSTEIEISNVTGLQDELDARPIKGPGYSTSRVAVINEGGQIEGAGGGDSDCVRVDGTAAPCGGEMRFADSEAPAGVVDGANAIYSLAHTPSPDTSLLLFRNGILQKRGFDYTIAGSAVTFLTGAVPQQGDVVLASYRY
jgi:hypothetical protein